MMIQLDKTIKKKAANTKTTFVYDLPDKKIVLIISRNLFMSKNPSSI